MGSTFIKVRPRFLLQDLKEDILDHLDSTIPDLVRSIPDLDSTTPDLGRSIPDLDSSIPDSVIQDLGSSILDLVRSMPDLLHTGWTTRRSG